MHLLALLTVLVLPNPAVSVNLRTPGTTIVTLGDTTFRGPSAFVYVTECALPDTPRYRCNISREDQVVLTAADHAPIEVTLLVKFESRLITSGHNYWRPTQTVLDGAVTLP